MSGITGQIVVGKDGKLELIINRKDITFFAEHMEKASNYSKHQARMAIIAGEIRLMYLRIRVKKE